MLRIRSFTVQNLEEGCVTDSSNPAFWWELESTGKDVKQTCAELTVGDWTVKLAGENRAVYRGASLRSFARYRAELCVTDNHGENASAELFFETGRMGAPWIGRWITDGAYRFTEKKASPVPMHFRKCLNLTKRVKRAVLYSTAMGIYQFYADGERVGGDYFAPGFTAYGKQLQYQTYDLTEQFENCGTHILTAVVGGGWAVGRYTYKERCRIYANRQALLAEVRIWFEDGSEQVIGTGSDWEVSMNGPFLAAEFYNGEFFDARRMAMLGHVGDRTDAANQTDRWHPACEEKLIIHPDIIAQYGDPVRAHEVFRPVAVTRSPSGKIIFDFGQNFAGVIRILLKGSAGQKITITHAEVLMDGELYREPLRSARQEAIYILKDGVQEYAPSLTYMGFRYAAVEGAEIMALSDAADQAAEIRSSSCAAAVEAYHQRSSFTSAGEAENPAASEGDLPQILRVEAVALYSDIRDNGSFSCSNSDLNRLQENIRWGAKSNFVDIPTDCPQRDERLGWTGDIALFSRTAVYNFDMSRFLGKWLRDVKAEQRWGGGIPMIVPFVKVYWQWELVVTMAVDHWGDACILVPWAEYLSKGDPSILREMYPVMEKYLRACRFWAGLFSFGKRRYIWKLLHHYGDWCAPGVDMWTWMRRGKYTATACLSNSAAIVSRISEILGKKENAAKYRKLHEDTADAYRSLLMDPDGRVRDEFQTAYVLPLYYGMLQGEDRKKAAEHLARMVRKNGYHIGTGFPGTPYVLFALADNGYPQEAFRMLLNDTCPSWLYEVKTGGTTIWERWDALREDGSCNTGEGDGTGGMVSFNHYASGAVGDFFYRRIAGIEPLEAGYRRFRIRPLICRDEENNGRFFLTQARGSVRGAYGEIVSDWKIVDDTFEIHIRVPAGTTCRAELPDGSCHEVGSGSWTYAVTVVKGEEGVQSEDHENC